MGVAEWEFFSTFWVTRILSTNDKKGRPIIGTANARGLRNGKERTKTKESRKEEEKKRKKRKKPGMLYAKFIIYLFKASSLPNARLRRVSAFMAGLVPVHT